MSVSKMDYQNGKIYAIRSHNTDKFYIGSTCSTLTKRFSEHKHKRNDTTVREIFKYQQYYIELLELYPCNSRIELNKREGELIRLHKDKCVNIQMKELPLTDEEKKEKQKQYYLDNKEKAKEYHKIRQFYRYYYTSRKEEMRAKLKEPEKVPL